MSETKSLAAPKASFDRRAVVKGAAWSVPVIAAAIAAPALRRAERTLTAAFLALMGNMRPICAAAKALRQTINGKRYQGFTITNSASGAITGAISSARLSSRLEAQIRASCLLAKEQRAPCYSQCRQRRSTDIGPLHHRFDRPLLPMGRWSSTSPTTTSPSTPNGTGSMTVLPGLRLVRTQPDARPHSRSPWAKRKGLDLRPIRFLCCSQ